SPPRQRGRRRRRRRGGPYARFRSRHSFTRSRAPRRSEAESFARPWIDEREPSREKLKRGISFLFFRDRGIERIADDRASDRCHVNSQLMLTSSFRKEPELSHSEAQSEQFDFSYRVDRPVHDPLAIPRFTRLHSILEAPMRSLERSSDVR